MKQTKKENQNEEFIKKYQGKLFCKCGCGKEIIIQQHHKYYGIPKYILGHNSKENLKYNFEKGHIPYNKGLKMLERCGEDNIAKRPEIKKKLSVKARERIKRDGHPKQTLGKHWKVKNSTKMGIGNKGKHTWNFNLTKKIDKRVNDISKNMLRYFQNNPEEKLRMKKQRKSLIFPVKDTSIEIKIQNFLKQLGIEYFTHQYMKINHGYQCDILIPSMNLVIECDGDYWHKYPVGRDIDHVRTKELIKKGFKVLRLWEFEINDMTIKEFERRIKN